MQSHCLGDILRRRWIRALVATGLAIIPATRAAALSNMHKGVGQTTSSYAFPAFSRQTGLACSSCHFQKYPALTPFGR